MHVRWSIEYRPKLATGPLQPASSLRAFALLDHIDLLTGCAFTPPRPTCIFANISWNLTRIDDYSALPPTVCLCLIGRKSQRKAQNGSLVAQISLEASPWLAAVWNEFSLDPSKGELLESSAGLGTDVKEMDQSRPGSFLPIILIVPPTPPKPQMRCRSFLSGSIPRLLDWEALNVPCAALSTVQS